jgi:hypothetical protein
MRACLKTPFRKHPFPMEIQPLINQLNKLQERTDVLRGYL